MMKTHAQPEPDYYLIAQRFLFPGTQTRGAYGTPGKAHSEVLLRLRDMIALEKGEKGKSNRASDVTSTEMYERFGVPPEIFTAYTGEELTGPKEIPVTLSADVLSICQQLGISPEEYAGVGKSAPVLLSAGRHDPLLLSADELSICRQLGMSPEEYAGVGKSTPVLLSAVEHAELQLLASSPITLGGGGAMPTRLKLLSWGENATGGKGTFIVNETTLAQLPANQLSANFDIVAFDFEHNTVPGTKGYQGEPCMVAGHGTPLVLNGEGLFLDKIEWTKEGASYIGGRHYIDVSASVLTSPKGEVVFLHSAAACRQGAAVGAVITLSPGILAAFPGR